MLTMSCPTWVRLPGSIVRPRLHESGLTAQADKESPQTDLGLEAEALKQAPLSAFGGANVP